MEQVNIEPAVVIKVKKSTTRPHLLRHEVTFEVSGVVDKIETDGFGDVLEPGIAGVFPGRVLGLAHGGRIGTAKQPPREGKQEAYWPGAKHRSRLNLGARDWGLEARARACRLALGSER